MIPLILRVASINDRLPVQVVLGGWVVANNRSMELLMPRELVAHRHTGIRTIQ